MLPLAAHCRTPKSTHPSTHSLTASNKDPSLSQPLIFLKRGDMAFVARALRFSMFYPGLWFRCTWNLLSTIMKLCQLDFCFIQCLLFIFSFLLNLLIFFVCKALCVVCNSSAREGYYFMIKKQNSSDLRIFACSTVLYFSANSNPHNLRNGRSLTQPRSHTKRYQMSFLPRAYKLHKQ